MGKKILMRTFQDINTYLDGLGVNVTTAALLAPLLGVNESDISKFTLIGNNVSCRVNVSYTTPIDAFNTPAGRAIRSFIDTEGKCTNFGSNTFKTVTGLMTEIYAPGIIIQTGGNLFQDAAGTAVLDMPNCTTLPPTFFGNWNGTGKLCKFHKVTDYGGSQGNDAVFNVVNSRKCTVEAAIINQTSNGGGVEGDLAVVIANSTGSVIWI